MFEHSNLRWLSFPITSLNSPQVTSCLPSWKSYANLTSIWGRSFCGADLTFVPSSVYFPEDLIRAKPSCKETSRQFSDDEQTRDEPISVCVGESEQDSRKVTDKAVTPKTKALLIPKIFIIRFLGTNIQTFHHPKKYQIRYHFSVFSSESIRPVTLAAPIKLRWSVFTAQSSS